MCGNVWHTQINLFDIGSTETLPMVYGHANRLSVYTHANTLADTHVYAHVDTHQYTRCERTYLHDMPGTPSQPRRSSTARSWRFMIPSSVIEAQKARHSSLRCKEYCDIFTSACELSLNSVRKKESSAGTYMEAYRARQSLAVYAHVYA